MTNRILRAIPIEATIETPKRSAWRVRQRLSGPIVALAAGVLLFAIPGHAQKSAQRVSDVRLKPASVSKLKMNDDLNKVVKFTGNTMRAKTGFKILKVGNVMYVANQSVNTPPAYVTQKAARATNKKVGDSCFVVTDICACAATLVNNMYGGNADDACDFSGQPSEASCGGEGCCGYMHTEVDSECPPGW